MAKIEADAEAKKIFEECVKKTIIIIEQAEKNGSWQMGLDSNKGLFEELKKETRKKLKELEEKIEKA